MRNEAVWLVQFLVADVDDRCGVRRRAVGRLAAVGSPRPATWDSLRAEVEVRPAPTGRPDLFAPEVDLRDPVELLGEVRGELSPGS